MIYTGWVLLILFQQVLKKEEMEVFQLVKLTINKKDKNYILLFTNFVHYFLPFVENIKLLLKMKKPIQKNIHT